MYIVVVVADHVSLKLRNALKKLFQDLVYKVTNQFYFQVFISYILILWYIKIKHFNLNNTIAYRIHSNKRPGRFDKSFRVGAYLFQYFLQGSTQKLMILAIFRLIPNHIEVSIMSRPMLVSWIDLGRWLIILWFIASKYDGWALIGAWAAIRTNTVIQNLRF